MYIMRNDAKSLLLGRLEKIPYFGIGSAHVMIDKMSYSRILLSRSAKKGEIVRLKKGFYASREYIDNVQKEGRYTSYLEFIACALYAPSYLSLEYVLQKHNALTESVVNFTLASGKKTNRFSNRLGRFIYHKIKEKLFTGFAISERDGFPIYTASKSKALFDYLYLRKHILPEKGTVDELRINADVFTKTDMVELKKYIILEGSTRMADILRWLFGGRVV